MIISIDVDEVCAELVDVWIEKYNKDYSDNLTKFNLSHWGIHNIIKPECGNKIYDYIEDGSIYDEVKPVEGSLWGIESLKSMGYRIIYATTSPLLSAGKKFTWLKDNGFIKKEEDYIELKDKSLLRSDYLIDDNEQNIRSFLGIGYIFTRPWNINYKGLHRVNNWAEIVDMFTIIKHRVN
jgi:5'(3')-deoxyribonucleotidase